MYSVIPVIVYVFPLLVCPYAKMLAKNKEDVGQSQSLQSIGQSHTSRVTCWHSYTWNFIHYLDSDTGRTGTGIGWLVAIDGHHNTGGRL